MTVADFGEGVALNPLNLIETNKFEVASGQVKVSVAPEYSYLVETRVVDGKKYMAQMNSKTVKTLNRVFAAGFVSEKEIQTMTVSEMLSIEGVTVQDMALISSLQWAIKEHCILEFLAGAKDFSSADKKKADAEPKKTNDDLNESEDSFDEGI